MRFSFLCVKPGLLRSSLALAGLLSFGHLQAARAQGEEGSVIQAAEADFWWLLWFGAGWFGFVVMIPFFTIFNGPDEVFVGPLARMIGSVDMAWLVGLIVSSVAYYVLCLSLDLKKEEELIRQIEKTSPQFSTGKAW